MPVLRLDPNTVPPEVLTSLPRMGRRCVDRWVVAREERPFRSLEDVRGRVARSWPGDVRADRALLCRPGRPRAECDALRRVRRPVGRRANGKRRNGRNRARSRRQRPAGVRGRTSMRDLRLMIQKRTRRLAIVMALAVVSARQEWTVFAQYPQARLSSLTRPGVCAGETAEVTLRGSDLEGTRSLWFDHGGLAAIHAKDLTFRISAGPDVPLGHHDVARSERLA